ncbi:MAG: hypothetical protein LBL92_01945, partial [Propionibacteriaceae bacterium]|jgi:hypothetical protein|nr:hypothetical protein [Propionibacteriaceae bacterium]
MTDAVTVIEWGLGLDGYLSDSWLEIELQRSAELADETRLVTVRAYGPRWVGHAGLENLRRSEPVQLPDPTPLPDDVAMSQGDPASSLSDSASSQNDAHDLVSRERTENDSATSQGDPIWSPDDPVTSPESPQGDAARSPSDATASPRSGESPVDDLRDRSLV